MPSTAETIRYVVALVLTIALLILGLTLAGDLSPFDTTVLIQHPLGK